ncbi:serine carboxypeptidase 45-like protein [Trifolium pratense]|uniref:Serine carboxypeptidase 45-like protein n=1 Tax=Trifolium pratense TaxID=57577 RepID=A0A2K3MUK1_TRIPR|nr:serine carboxypeptidase 45-like protein [Trifolium pratense]
MIEMNKRNKIFNLKGIALGNPVLEYATDFNSRAEFFWSHGLISDATYNMFTTVCNYSRYVSEYNRDSVSSLCSKVMGLVTKETSRFVDKYDVTLDVCISSVLSQSKIISPQPQQANEMIDVCVDDKVTNYLNRRDVQEALHAKLVGVRKWDVCSNVLDYDVLNLEVPTLPVVGSLIKAGVRVLIYSGDQDSVIPLTGSRTLVQKLGRQLGLNTTVPYRVWFEGQQWIEEENESIYKLPYPRFLSNVSLFGGRNSSPQAPAEVKGLKSLSALIRSLGLPLAPMLQPHVGGWTQVYGNILSFATVRGAAHEAPFSQPERSLVLFKSFLEGSPLPEVF